MLKFILNLVLFTSLLSAHESLSSKSNIEHVTKTLALANSSQIIVNSEGGSQVTNSPLLSLLNDTQTLDNSKVSRIKPRKNATTFDESPEVDIDKDNVKPAAVVQSSEEKIILDNVKQPSLQPSQATNKEFTGKVSSVETIHKIRKKPLVLQSDALSEENDMKETLLPSTKSSSKTIVSDQIPSPHKGEVVQKVHISMAERNPDLVMPVVITILVVPVFAIFGYIALKKGREAWKNRHYKRMDFLLDGMYNE